MFLDTLYEVRCRVDCKFEQCHNKNAFSSHLLILKFCFAHIHLVLFFSFCNVGHAQISQICRVCGNLKIKLRLFKPLMNKSVYMEVSQACTVRQFSRVSTSTEVTYASLFYLLTWQLALYVVP